MENKIKLHTLVISLFLIMCSFGLTITATLAWFNGQGYAGKTMSYDRRMYIGSTSSEIINYYGYYDSSENFLYAEINPITGFENNNLIPNSYLFIRSDITNTSATYAMNISLFLQNIVYDEPLNSYLYFGTNDPVISREIYKTIAVYDESTEKYTIDSIPLLSITRIEPSATLSLYWYVYIDSDAGMEVANCSINLGNVAITYNS